MLLHLQTIQYTVKLNVQLTSCVAKKIIHRILCVNGTLDDDDDLATFLKVLG